jgi:uncharacterized protein YecT (DUF1311 family)
MSKRVLLVLGLLVPLGAAAQYEGPAVQACRTLAMKDLARDGIAANEVVLEAEALEGSKRSVGSQAVSSVWTGNGAVVLKGAPSVELTFICLLADEKRPVFFAWLPRPHPPALAQCGRSAELRADAGGCLEVLLRTAERDLGEAYAHRFQEANARGDAALATYRRANDEWREYRDAECARRREFAPASVTPDHYHAACVVELTRRRVQDMR